MRWMALCLFAIPLAAGCSTYGSYGDTDAGADAGTDAGVDAGADPGADPGGVPGGNPDADDDGQDCDRVYSVGTGEPGPCEPLWLPCGYTMTQMGCDDDEQCLDGAPCWYGACTAPDLSPWSVGEDCVEARVQVLFGGADPDRIYEYDLSTPPLEHADGRVLSSAAGMWFLNPVPCIWIDLDECWTYHVPVELSYDADGLRVRGGSGFTLYRLRSDPADPIGPGWLASGESVDLQFGAVWQFGPGGNEELEWWKSVLRAELYWNDDACVTRTVLEADLLPEWQMSVTALPRVQTICP